LQALVLVQGREQETELILEVVQVGGGTVGEVGRFNDETLCDEAATPEMIEDYHVADKETVGSAFEHKSDANGRSGDGDFLRAKLLAHLVNAGELFGELLDGAGAGEIVEGGFGFADVSKRPLDVRANECLATVLVQTRAQRSVGRLQPDMERMTIQVGRVGFGGSHGCSSESG
jgi:hypothetical protein